MNAISIVLHDPTGRQTGETYPANSTWYWNHTGEAQRKRRSDAGRLKARDKSNASVDSTTLSKGDLLSGERPQESGATAPPAPTVAADGLQS